MPYLNRDNGDKIFYDIHGKPGDTPVITLHGFLENGSYWSRPGVSPAIAEAGYCVYDMDMRGHGRSIPSADAPDFSLETLVSDIGALADHLGLERFHLIGHATGGIVAARYMMANFERLLSFTSSDSASMTYATDTYADPEWDDKPIPPLEFRPGEYTAQAMQAFGTLENYVAQARAADPENMFAQFYRAYAGNADPERCWRWTKEIHCVNNIEYCIAFVAGNGLNDPDPRVKDMRRATCPCLLIVGEEDYGMIKPMEIMARSLPNAEFVKMKGVSHMTTIEAPEETTELILSFLKKH